ncbi:MAG: hypothetical protein R3B47_01395 [Bacteroidia bacterium]
MKQLVLGFLFLASLGQSMYAQQQLNQILSDWYLEERFILVDKDKDALLDRGELQQFNQEFAYYLEPRNFLLSDTDGDGKLSYREMRTRVVVEFNYRYAREVEALTKAYAEAPGLRAADAAWLKSHPAITASLFGNLYWMNNHSELAREVYQDKEWMQEQSNVLASLQRNICWLVTHPADAKQLYKDLKISQKAPEMMSWRAAHKNLLRRYNELPEDIVLSFLPK